MFDFSRHDEWPKWSRRFELFRQASGLVIEEEESKINTLIYAMGDQADDIFNSFKLNSTQMKQYHTIKRSLMSISWFAAMLFSSGQSSINACRQEEGEKVDRFITALHALAEHCNFGSLKGKLIRDRIAVGLQDSKLSEKLQLNPELTLTKAINQARQSEAVKKTTTNPTTE